MIRLIGSIVFIFIISSLYAEDIKIISSSAKGLTFEFRLQDYNISPVSIGNRAYARIDVIGTGMINDIGKPALPVKYIHFAIPLGIKDVNIYIKKEGKKAIKNIRIIPDFQMMWKNLEIKEDPSIYEKDAYFPGKDYEKIKHQKEHFLVCS